MKQLLALIKLEFALKFPKIDKNKKLWVKIFDAIAILIGVGIVAALVMFMFKSIISVCVRSDLGAEFLIFFILIVQLVQLFMGLGLLTKTLFFNIRFILEDSTKVIIIGNPSGTDTTIIVTLKVRA